MVLLLPSSCIPPTIQDIFLIITADGRDGADCDGACSVDADGDDANHGDDQNANRESGTVSPTNSNLSNVGRMFCMQRVYAQCSKRLPTGGLVMRMKR